MSVPYQNLLNPSDNITALLKDQNATGLNVATYNGSEPFDNLVTKAVFNYDSASGTVRGSGADGKIAQWKAGGILGESSATTLAGYGITDGETSQGSANWRANLGSAPVNLMIDIDWGQDADDIGSLAVAHRLADLGEVNIIAIGGSFIQPAVSEAIVAFNTFYGRPNIPVGQAQTGVAGSDNYLTATAAFPNRQQTTTPPTAVSVYRKAMASMPNNSILWYVEGPMTNLNAVLNSAPDSISPLTGAQLMAQKLYKPGDPHPGLVVLGGIYPGGGAEYDFTSDPMATQVINQLTSAITVVFQGLECGQDVQTNSNQPAWSIVKTGYTAFFAAYGGTTRSSWGALGVIYCVRGLAFGSDTYFTLSAAGTNSVDVDGNNTWTPGGSKGQKYLIQSLGNSSFATVIQTLQDALPLQNNSTPVWLSSGAAFNYPLDLNPATASQINLFNAASFRGTIGADDGNSIITGAGAGDISIRGETGKYWFSYGSVNKLKIDGTTSGGTTISDLTANAVIKIVNPLSITPATLAQVNFQNTSTYRGTIGIDDGGSIITDAAAGVMAIRAATGIYEFAGTGITDKLKIDTTSGSGTTISNPTASATLNLTTGAGGTVQINSVPASYVVAAPSTAASSGAVGMIAFDASFFYICVAANTWKRSAIATW